MQICGRSLPTFVEKDYRSKGLKIAAVYWVVEWKDLPDPGAPPSSDGALLAAGFCLLVAVFLFLMMVIAKVAVTQMRKKPAVR